MSDEIPTLEEDLRALLNRHSAENNSDTPDFILASYLLTCLDAFDAASLARDVWFGLHAHIQYIPERDAELQDEGEATEEHLPGCDLPDRHTGNCSVPIDPR